MRHIRKTLRPSSSIMIFVHSDKIEKMMFDPSGSLRPTDLAVVFSSMKWNVENDDHVELGDCVHDILRQSHGRHYSRMW